MFKTLEICLYAFRDQISSSNDTLFVFTHWCLVNKGFQCIDSNGKPTEILPKDWNSNQSEYIVSYSHNSKGYELKMLEVDDTLIINLMRKSSERTANVTCNPKDHIINHKNEFQNLFLNLHDLYEKIDKEFDPLIKSDKEEKPKSSSENNSTSSLQVGPVRGGGGPQGDRGYDQRLTQPYVSPDDYGRSDLDPFRGGFDPLRGPGGGMAGGGMVFDPFRGSNRPMIPGNLPPGAVPPGARFDPFNPPMPDDLTGGMSAMRAGPNPSHLRPPNFEDQFM